jgi:hypothetical protein
MPPWRGEGMTGTRASGCPRPAVAGDGAAAHLDTPPKGGPRQGTAPSSLSILRQPLTAPRSFVLAALRALHPDPVGGLTPARLYGGNGAPPRRASFPGIDRPRSFRDDTQKNRSARHVAEQALAVGQRVTARLGADKPVGDALVKHVPPDRPRPDIVDLGGLSVACHHPSRHPSHLITGSIRRQETPTSASQVRLEYQRNARREIGCRAVGRGVRRGGRRSGRR